jgi:hypothetical protein
MIDEMTFFFILVKKDGDVRFEVFMTMTMKIAFFWDMTPCSLLDKCKHFIGTRYPLFYSHDDGGF